MANDIYVSINGDASGLINAVKQANLALGSIATNASSATKNLDAIANSNANISKSLSLIKVDAFVNLGKEILGAVKSLSEFADVATVSINRLNMLTGSVENSRKVFGALVESANKTGSAIDDVAKLFVKVASAGQTMGLGFDDARKITENLTYMLVQTGVEGRQATATILHFVQALSTGTVTFQELTKLQMEAPQILDAVAQYFGRTRAEFLADVQAYKVGSRDIADALMNIKDDGVAPFTMTLEGALNVLRNNFIKSLDDLQARTGIFTKIGEGIIEFSHHLDIAGEALAILVGWWAGAKIAVWGGMFLEAAAGVIALYKEIRTLGVLAAVAEAVATGGLSAILTVVGGSIGAYMAYEKVNKVFDNLMAKQDGASGSLDKYQKKLDQTAPKVERAYKGPQVSDYTLKSELDVIMKVNEAKAATGNATQLQIEGEKILAELSTKAHISIENIRKSHQAIVDLINERILREAVLQAQQKAYQQTPTGIMDKTSTYSINIAGADQGKTQAALAGNLTLAKQFDDQLIIATKAREDAILSIEQKAAEDRMKLNGVTNQSIIDAVKEQMKNVQMIQMGGVQGFQGMLGAIDNVMASMSAQNRKAFEAHKALATAQAVISTYQAAAEAIAFPPGPPLSFIYVAGAIAAGMAQVAAIQSQTYSGKALGGSVMSNTPYIVGEKGPEMFVPAGSGTIIPNSDLKGGQPVNINFNIQANDAAGFDTLLNQRRSMVTQMVRDAMQENGQRMRM